MLDIKWIRDNQDAFLRGLETRGYDDPKGLLGELLTCDEERRTTIQALQEMQAERNAASKEIGKAKAAKDGAKAKALMDQVAGLKTKIQEGEARERELEATLRDKLVTIPNMPAADVPVGPDESANQEIRKWGEPRELGLEPKQHFELGEALGLMDFETAAKLSGARFVVLKGALARLERALGAFMLDLHGSEHGYTEINPPFLVRDDTMFGTGQLPKFAEDLFSACQGLASKTRIDAQRSNEHLENVEGIASDRWLIPTAEVPLTNMVRGDILDETVLPMRVTAFTPCFRAEAGAAGKDTRGMIRQHQFSKVELVSITTPQQSAEEHERMTGAAEEVLKRLGLPYRVVLLSTGDMGFSANKTYDLEVWLPGQGAYREISSCSNCGDFQARRMNARYRPEGAKETRFVHTLNGSGVAVGRCLVAILENYQQADGSIRIPDVLRRYMGGLETIAAGQG